MSSSTTSSSSTNRRVRRCGTICVKIIFNTVHLLVVRGKRSHIWSLPKGCIQDGEQEWRCAQRETQEETGLWVNIVPTKDVKVCINHNVYFLQHIDQHSKLSSRDHTEVDKVSWMTLEELRQVECNKDLRSILQYPTRKFGFHQALLVPLQLDKLPLPPPQQDSPSTSSASEEDEDSSSSSPR